VLALVEPDPSDAAAPRLRGSRCAVCARVHFPPLTIGCDACGAERLEGLMLEAVGVVHAVATVQTYAGRYETPFVVGQIRLSAGPLILAIMRGDATIGDAVEAAWVKTGLDERDDGVEPLFARVAP
jgi:uncharacterized protein